MFVCFLDTELFIETESSGPRTFSKIYFLSEVMFNRLFLTSHIKKIQKRIQQSLKIF